MILEKREFKVVLDELLGPRGNSLFLRPALDYLVDADEEVPFLVLSRRLRTEGAILLGG